jgi:hypothetical protein
MGRPTLPNLKSFLEDATTADCFGTDSGAGDRRAAKVTSVPLSSADSLAEYTYRRRDPIFDFDVIIAVV